MALLAPLAPRAASVEESNVEFSRKIPCPRGAEITAGTGERRPLSSPW